MMEAMGGPGLLEPAAKDTAWTAIQDVIEMRLSQNRTQSSSLRTGSQDTSRTRERGHAASPDEDRALQQESTGGLRAFRKLLRGLFAAAGDKQKSAVNELSLHDPTAVLPSSPPRREQRFSPLRQLLQCTKLGQRLWVGSLRTGDHELLDALFPAAKFSAMTRIVGERVGSTRNCTARSSWWKAGRPWPCKKPCSGASDNWMTRAPLARETARAAIALHTAQSTPRTRGR